MSKSIGVLLILTLTVALLLCTESTFVSSQTQSNTPISAPAIEWQQDYEGKINSVSNIIQTSDGGFAYLTDASIIKTDSKNNRQWIKNLTYPFIDAHPTYTSYRLELFSLIETSDGALAALGVGYNLAAYVRWGKIYFIKTEAFLPLPSQTPLPTPIPTPILTPSATPLPTQNVEAIALVSLIIGMVAGAGLMLFLKKRKH